MSKKTDALMELLKKSDPAIYAQAQAILDAEQVSTSNRAKITAELPAVLASEQVKAIAAKYAKLANTVKTQEGKLDADKQSLVALTGEFVKAIADSVKVADCAKYLDVTGAEDYDPGKTWLAPVILYAGTLDATVRERAAIAPKPADYKRPSGFKRNGNALASDATDNQKKVVAACGELGKIYHVKDFIAALGRKSGIDVKEEGLTPKYFDAVYTDEKAQAQGQAQAIVTASEVRLAESIPAILQAQA